MRIFCVGLLILLAAVCPAVTSISLSFSMLAPDSTGKLQVTQLSRPIAYAADEGYYILPLNINQVFLNNFPLYVTLGQTTCCNLTLIRRSDTAPSHQPPTCVNKPNPLDHSEVYSDDDAYPITKFCPKLPEFFFEQNISGSVTLRYTVLTDGSAADIIVISSSGYAELDRSCAEAILRMRFQPATANGKPVVTSTEQTICFSRSSPKPLDQHTDQSTPPQYIPVPDGYYSVVLSCGDQPDTLGCVTVSNDVLSLADIKFCPVLPGANEPNYLPKSDPNAFLVSDDVYYETDPVLVTPLALDAPDKLLAKVQNAQTDFEVEILTDGTVRRVVVVNSCGEKKVDAAAVLAMRGARFVPALAGGKPVAVRITMPVMYNQIKS